MWIGLITLLLFSLVMAGASFLAGLLPLSITLSSRQLRLISALGTGVLVGTSLIVIIPEGVATLYRAQSPVDIALNGRSPELASFSYQNAPIFDAAPILPRYSAPIPHDDDDDDDDDDHDHEAPHNPALPPSKQKETTPLPPTHESHTSSDPHAWIGISLISGFVLMYLIDTVPQYASSSSRPQRFAVSLNQFSFNRRTPSMSSESLEPPRPDTLASSLANAPPRATATTVGLVIHAAADGIALGASTATPAPTHLSLIIFLALMIHKAPAAFGLTTVLLKQGLHKRLARVHLLVFSLAAPAAALGTWAVVHLLGWAHLSSSSLSSSTTHPDFATGLLLLFSGGTFLYVAMHTMQEGASAGGAASRHDDAAHADTAVSMDASAAHKHNKPALEDLAITVAGMLLPLVTQWGHAH